MSEFSELIAKVGGGPKTAKDLTWDEAKRAMRAMIEGQATLVQVGAFLMALRVKGESVTELAAFTAAAREYAAAVPVSNRDSLIDLPSYAGKTDTFHASIPAALIAAATGARVLMHGYQTTPTRPGIAVVLEKLGLQADAEPKCVAEQLDGHGIGYLDLSLHHPPLAKFLDLRQELGVRTLFHPVARMLNPARSCSQVIGLSHPPYFERMAEALSMLGSERALVLRGVEGEPELSIAGMTKVLELRAERITPLALQPKDVGLPIAPMHAMGGFAPGRLDQECDLIARILSNQVKGGPRDWVLLNAAMLLYAAGRAPSIAGSFPLALHALESGTAAKKLADVVKTTQPTAGR